MKQGQQFAVRVVIPIFYCYCLYEMWKYRLLKYKSFEDVKEVYGEDNLIKLCNIKQIVQYAVMKCQPVWIDEGYDGKLIAYYYKPETEKAWNYWRNNK